MDRDSFENKWAELKVEHDLTVRGLLRDIYDSEITPRDERIAEKDRTIATLSEQVDNYLKERDQIRRADVFNEAFAKPEPMPPVPDTLPENGDELFMHYTWTQDSPKDYHRALCYRFNRIQDCLRVIYKRMGVKP